jgi:hypothetical protein
MVSYKRRYNYMLSESEAKAAEKEAKDEELVRFSFNDMLSALKDATNVQSPAYMDPASGIPHHVSHPAGPTPLLPPEAPFDKIRARSGSNGSKDDLLAVHAAYIGEDPSDKKSFALPHHLGTDPHACNLKAVKSCLKSLGVKVDASGVVPSAHPEVPEHGNQIAKSHLLQHIDQFKKAADAEKEEVVNAVKAAMQEDDGHGDGDHGTAGDLFASPVKPGAISYLDAHGDKETPTAPPESDYDAKAEVSKCGTDSIKLKTVHAAWDASDASNPKAFSYPHHQGSAPYKAVLKPVAAIAKKFHVDDDIPVKGVDSAMTENDESVLRGHIARHLKQFNKN